MGILNNIGGNPFKRASVGGDKARPLTTPPVGALPPLPKSNVLTRAKALERQIPMSSPQAPRTTSRSVNEKLSNQNLSERNPQKSRTQQAKELARKLVPKKLKELVRGKKKEIGDAPGVSNGNVPKRYSPNVYTQTQQAQLETPGVRPEVTAYLETAREGLARLRDNQALPAYEEPRKP